MTDKSDVRQAIERVKQMEACLDTLQKAVRQSEEISTEDLQMLVRYYESGQWLKDYEMDENGLLPHNLKRGVLSQDAVYDLLDRIREDASGNV